MKNLILNLWKLQLKSKNYLHQKIIHLNCIYTIPLWTDNHNGWSIFIIYIHEIYHSIIKKCPVFHSFWCTIYWHAAKICCNLFLYFIKLKLNVFVIQFIIYAEMICNVHRATCNTGVQNWKSLNLASGYGMTSIFVLAFL